MIAQVIIVLAKYCPHCVPFSLQNSIRLANALKVPLCTLNIEIPAQEKVADRLVEDYGDWSEDYLIPQVFLKKRDGGIDHILTGFSEAISVTEASWDAFFSSKYYHNLISAQGIQYPPLRVFIDKYLRFKSQCRGHCDKSSFLLELNSNSETFVGAYICPDQYVSRVVCLSVNRDIARFKNFLLSQLDQKIVNDKDIRPATRHGWELGNDALSQIIDVSPTGKVTEVYWSISPKLTKERNFGVFLCNDPVNELGCRRLFVQELQTPNKLCKHCELL